MISHGPFERSMSGITRGLSLPRGDAFYGGSASGVPAPHVCLFRSFSCSMLQVSSGHTPVISSFVRPFREFWWLSLSFVSFSVSCFSGQAASDGRSGSCFRRRSGSSFRRRSGSSFRRRSGSSFRRALSPAVWPKLSPLHAFVPCFLPVYLCLSPVASSPRSRALSSCASPVLLGF
jgi:hypothetical protein